MTAPCPVAYCRAPRGHRTLHDIPSCLRTCGPLRYLDGICLGRLHDPKCPNHRPAQSTDYPPPNGTQNT